MILFIGCGNKVDKVPEQEKTEDPIQEEIEIEEEPTDVESTEEESEWEILWEKDETFANSDYHIEWSRSDNETIVIIHTVKSSDLNELAACVAMGLQDIQAYKDYPHVTVNVIGQSSNPDNTKPYILISSALGISGIEEDGTEVKESPKWMTNADIKAIAPSDSKAIEQSLLSLYDKESAVADIYLK